MAERADHVEGQTPVSPPTDDGLPARRKKANRGRAGGRTHGQTVWFTEGERALLAVKAGAAGMSLASYLRAAALGDAGPRAKERITFDKEALGRAITELNRVGNNVNQIARRGNTGQEIDGFFADQVGQELRGVLRRMLEAFNA